MSYQVIARKWRPQTFEEVTGQEAITRTLKNAIEHDRLHHAYLFSGARGVGKTTTARLLGKALNCHKSDKPTINPCSFNDSTACASCREIAEGRSIDVIEFDAASNTQVDKIRDLILENIDIAPARDRYKIFIIDEVHMLSTSSFNALLKTLEEPPPRVVFIMATTELHKVPDTILSRCQQFEFRTIALNKIVERLKLIAEAEKINVTEIALREIARAGEGSMRDAQSAFDQTISFSGEKIDVEDVTVALGIASSELLVRVVAAIADKKPAEALKVVDELVSRGQDLRNFCRDLLTFLRDLLVVKVAGDAEHLVESSSTNLEELEKYAQVFTESDLTRFFHSLSETETKLKEALQPRYVLEVGLVKLIEMNRVASIEKILERLAQLEAALNNGGGNFPSNSTPPAGNKPIGTENAAPTQSSSTQSAAPKNFAPPASLQQPSGFNSAAIEHRTSSHISNFVPPSRPSFQAPAAVPVATVEPAEVVDFAAAKAEKIAPKSDAPNGDLRETLVRKFEERNLMWLALSIEKANFVKNAGNELLIEFAANHKHHQITWEKPENVKTLQSVCLEILGRELPVTVSVSGLSVEAQLSPEETEQKREKEKLWKMAEEDPGVKAFLEVFRGKILDVYKIEEPDENQLQEKAG
ncbi:MAG: DNA polymerase III subunit gamma/tau [Acidobacteriota bacterium]|nr:DNA polymerase III subunit gamma/tau [Acidobacteriota bacterium]